MRVSLRALTILALFASTTAPSSANARKFDFKTATFASYIRGTYGPSLVGGDAYANSSGTNAVVSRRIESNYSGEFGLLVARGAFNLRFAGELLIPAAMGTIEGTTSSGASLFTLNSKLRALLGMAKAEIALKQGSHWKLLAIAGAGYGWVTLDNEYQMTAAGTASSGLSSFTESAQGGAPAFEGALAIEFLFTDTATLAIEGGYRYMKVQNLTYANDQTTFQGAKKGGATVVDNNGADRKFDLGGPFVGLSLRFYL